METITKKKLVQSISQKHRLDPKLVGIIVEETLDQIRTNLGEGKRFEFRNFGVLEVVKRKQKIGRNPRAPEQTVVIPPRNTVKFTPGKKLKELLMQAK